MINKEKLLLLATIYMLVPGAMPGALADGTEGQKNKHKKAPAVHKLPSKPGQDRTSGAQGDDRQR